MQIVASQDVGKLGPSVSSPVTISWHWAYHLPGYLIWLVVVVLLQRRENRTPQAWLILLPMAAVVVALRMLARLFSLPDDSTDTTGGFVLTVAVAWTCVWLISPSLSRLRAGTAFCVALGLMLLVGVLAYFGQFEFAVDETMAIWTGFVAAASGTLLIAVLLSRYCRGAQYRSKPFLMWLLLWSVVVSALVTPLIVIVPLAALMIGEGGAMAIVMIVGQAITLVVAGALLGFVLYLVNLPFVLLANRCPLYRRRLGQVLQFSEEPADAVEPIELADELVHS